MRAHPRSLAGGGTTAPCSGQVCGRGVSQCHDFRTLLTSSIAPPATPASLVSGPSEYQANQRIRPLILVTAPGASAASLKAIIATSNCLFSQNATYTARPATSIESTVELSPSPVAAPSWTVPSAAFRLATSESLRWKSFDVTL